MQEIQPDVKRLQKEYKADREELQKQLMELYRERGVNPAAGCLPLILQMPVWFALFSVLRISAVDGRLTGSAIPESSDLGRALLAGNTDFLGMHLEVSPSQAFAASAADAIPYIVLVVIVILSGVYQQRQATRKRKDAPEQVQNQAAQGAQTALKFMPLLFGVFSWNFPSGLVTYFAASNIFRIGQQAVILGLDGPSPGRAKDATAAPPQPPEEGESRSGPSPNASKKRNKRRRK
jgi:YidC/Oxa1 family membrane protein insertase